MQIAKRNIELVVDDSLMRVYVASPKLVAQNSAAKEAVKQYPGILFYSDIYQLGGPIIRLANHLAGYGYVVAAPEIFHRLEPVGTVIEPTDLGRMQGNDAARRTAIASYDADAHAVIAWLKQDSRVDPAKIGTMGFCIETKLLNRIRLVDGILHWGTLGASGGVEQRSQGDRVLLSHRHSQWQVGTRRGRYAATGQRD